MAAPMTSVERIVINRRIVTAGTFVEVQKKGKGTTIETHRVEGWKIGDDGQVEYLFTYGGKPGYAKSSIVRPDQVRAIPLPKRQIELAALADARSLPKPSPRRRGGR